MGVLSYLSPQEVLVGQPTRLQGSFDPQAVSNVTVVAEDKYSLPVTLNTSTQTWQVDLDRGFSSAGVRWLRLQGTDRSNQVKSDRIVYLTVSDRPMTEADSLNLRILQDTWFKVSTTDSNRLDGRQKIRVKAGQTFAVRRYGASQGHLKVDLTSAIDPVGDFGYLYQPHVQLTWKGQTLRFEDNQLPAPQGGTLVMWVMHNTKMKSQPISSQLLDPNQQVELLAGQTLTVLGYACIDGHFRVTLAESVPNLGRSVYLYSGHVRLKHAEGWAEYDRNAYTVTLLRTTPFKKRPIDSSQLSSSDKIDLLTGMIYGVSSFAVEGSHLRVALTENLPGFGNTGYLYLDFIQLKQGGQPFNIFPGLDYRGPTEVLVNQPITLQGKFDPQNTVSVALIAEDKHSLPVSLNRKEGLWRVKLDRGFQIAGSRWLRLKSSDRTGKLLGNHIIYITVSSDALTVGAALKVKLLRDTLFKVAPVDSARLNSRQKVELKAGQVFEVAKYGFTDGHLKVSLKYPLQPVGDFGYFFEPHVQLTKGNQVLRFDIEDVPNTPVTGQMLVTETTYIKGAPEDAAGLSSSQKEQLLLGQNFGVRGYASTAGHFRVTLTESVPNFGDVGYVFRQHVQLRKEGKLIAYDPDSLTVIIQKETLLKRRPVDSGQLSAKDRVSLPVGRIYGVEGYKTESNHVKVTLTEELPGYGNTGYLYPGHILVRRGSTAIDLFPKLPKRVELNVPYFSQRDNPRYYWSTCNVTAIAMVLYYYGLRPSYSYNLADELLEWILDRYGIDAQTDHTVLQQLIRAYGFKSSFSTTRKWSEIDWELANGRPLVLAGDFTATGHIVTVIGYAPEGLIVNDPWGDAYTGYTNTEGRRLMYHNGYINQVCGPDGNIWAHFISPSD
ncbi:MAG: C39 family peptidase [Geitlerinemataceae cyanobacterium]